MNNSPDIRPSVSNDALDTLGTFHTRQEQRDAIHLAVYPVISQETLHPGQSISVVDGVAFADEDGVGIVDPFLPDGVEKGDRFWFILRPRLVHSLRHVWSHPAFDDEPEAA